LEQAPQVEVRSPLEDLAELRGGDDGEDLQVQVLQVLPRLSAQRHVSNSVQPYSN
jgi:hypothetical protein